MMTGMYFLENQNKFPDNIIQTTEENGGWNLCLNSQANNKRSNG